MISAARNIRFLNLEDIYLIFSAVSIIYSRRMSRYKPLPSLILVTPLASSLLLSWSRISPWGQLRILHKVSALVARTDFAQQNINCLRLIL